MVKPIDNTNLNGGSDDKIRNESGSMYPIGWTLDSFTPSAPPAPPAQSAEFEQSLNAAQQQLQLQQHQKQQQQQQQSCAPQQTAVSYRSNGHSRNPSSINGITITTQVIQPPPNKPDAINNFLKIIRFRSEDGDEKSKNPQFCGIREARYISK